MKEKHPASCPLEKTLHLVVGKWKHSGVKRYGEIKRFLPHASEKMLIQALRALEKDGLVKRKVYPVIPPKVEYSLTAKGKTLTEILCSLDRWGKKNL